MNVHPVRRALAPLALLLFIPALPAQPAGAAAPSDESVKLNPFEVTASTDRGYGALYNMGGSRINASSMDEPMSVITINQQLLQDIAPQQAIDALQWVSGVANTLGSYQEQFTIRGYQISTSANFVDGLPNILGSTNVDFTNMAGIDRIEVVKGPAGVEYGSVSPGGLVDVIRKQPLPYNQAIVSATYGSWRQYRGTVDANVAGGAKHQFEFRMIYDYQNGENPLGGPQGQIFYNPILYYRISDKATAWIRFEYTSTRTMYQETSIISDSYSNLSTMHSFFSPLKDVSGTASVEFKYNYEAGASAAFEALGTTWNVRMVGRLTRFTIHANENNLTGVNFINAASQTYATIANGGSFLDPRWVDITITRLERLDWDHWEHANGDIDLAGQYDWGAVRDIFDTYTYAGYSYVYNKRVNYLLPPEDLLHPVQYPNIFNAITGFNNIASIGDSTTVGFASGAQDNLQLFNDRLILVGGARWDWGWQSSTNYLNTTNAATSAGTDDAWTFKYGAVGKPIPTVPGLAVFYDRANTFTPQVGFLNNNPGTPIKSLIGQMDEGGVKLNLFNGLMTGTASAFKGTLSNQIVQPPDVNGVRQLQAQLGVNVTKGWEGDLDIEPLPPVSLLLAYTNLTTKDPNGLYTRDVPEGASYKGLGKYTLLDGPLKGLAAGFGYIYVSKHAGVAGATFILPAYNYSTGFLTYRTRTWTAQLNVNNVFNQAYAAGSTSMYEIDPGPSREVKFSVTYFMK